MSGRAPYPSGPLTDVLLAFLAGLDTTVAVGDGIKPKGAGWSGGQAGKGVFAPYVVLDLSAATSGSTDDLRDTQGDWRQTATISGFGGSRAQASFATDTVRAGLGDAYMLKSVITGWNLVDTTYVSLGGPVRDDATDPPTWRVVDSVVLRLLRA